VKLVSIVGARPQFIKLAPLEREITRHNGGGGDPIESIIVHTGQHYDAGMSDVFFDELNIPRAHYSLNVGSGSHGDQTARMLTGLEETLLLVTPDIVTTYGDTNSTLAGSLAAAKLHIPLVHVEAGLRSHDRKMPEEINRLVADHVSDLLLAPTPTAIRNLELENLAGRSVLTGDIMYDAALYNRGIAQRKSAILSRLSLQPGAFGLVTIHRASNTDDENILGQLLETLNETAANSLPLVFPAHPRTAGMIQRAFPDWTPHARLSLVKPLGYLDMLALLDAARLCLTDSGGLQKEAFFLGCPCIILRDETEWVETVEAGRNLLAGTDAGRINSALAHVLDAVPCSKQDAAPDVSRSFGDGNAARKILDAIMDFSGHQVS
jgi:UDP-N-acetylglucosamine 2-epimerase